MLRISSELSQSNNVLHVEGRLRANNVPELEQAFSAHADKPDLDLKNLIFADEQGLRLLRTLADEGTELLNVSPLIRMLLEQPNE